MYEPTKYQKSAFRVRPHKDGKFYLDKTRRLPQKSMKSAHQYSIAKWWVIRDALADGTHITDGGEAYTCALCQICERCKGCPIDEYTDGDGCESTPQRNFLCNSSVEEGLDIAQRELGFLQKLYERRFAKTK